MSKFFLIFMTQGTGKTRMKFDTPQEVLDYIELIEKKYTEAKKAKISRLDPKWGIWSRQMNIATKNKQGLAYKYLFIYWVIHGQLLELHYKSRFKQAKKKRLSKEAGKVRRYILKGDAPDISDNELKTRLIRSIK